MHPVNERIERLRQEKKLNQIALSEALGMRQGSFSKKLNSNNPFTIDQLKIIAKTLKTSLDYIIDEYNIQKGNEKVFGYNEESKAPTFYTKALEMQIDDLRMKINQLNNTKVGLIEEIQELKDSNKKLQEEKDTLYDHLRKIDNTHNPKPAHSVSHQSG